MSVCGTAYPLQPRRLDNAQPNPLPTLLRPSRSVAMKQPKAFPSSARLWLNPLVEEASVLEQSVFGIRPLVWDSQQSEIAGLHSALTFPIPPLSARALPNALSEL